MSHPDPLFDADNAYDDDDISLVGDEDDSNYDDYHDYHDDSMDGDHDSAMTSCGWGTDEDYGHYGDDIDAFHDYYGDDF
jgi:hypothetical protein